ncbi:hypothetical protein ACSBR1_024525 [Camellia fascicularis]
MNKGQDRATVMIEKNIVTDNSINSQNIREDPVGEYLSMIFNFIERLTFHLTNEQPIVFQDYDDLDAIWNRVDLQQTMFTQWMLTNKIHAHVKQLHMLNFLQNGFA